jgi:hypothetical protein
MALMTIIAHAHHVTMPWPVDPLGGRSDAAKMFPPSHDGDLDAHLLHIRSASAMWRQDVRDVRCRHAVRHRGPRRTGCGEGAPIQSCVDAVDLVDGWTPTKDFVHRTY